MHRSGTSPHLFSTAPASTSAASFAADAGNREGYFEDEDFVELHRKALAAAGLGPRLDQNDIRSR